MATEDDVPCECPDDYDPDEGGFAPPVDVPPHVADQVALTDAEVSAALADVHAAISETISDVRRELDSALADVHLSMASAIGATDAALREAASPVFGALVKVIDQTFRELVMAEEGLKAEGVYVPLTADDKRAMLADESGDSIIAALMGQGPRDIPTGSVTPPPIAPEVSSGQTQPAFPGVPLAQSVYFGAADKPDVSGNLVPAPVSAEPVAPVGGPAAPVAADHACDCPASGHAEPAPTNLRPAPGGTDGALPLGGKPLEFFDTLSGLTPGAPPAPDAPERPNRFAGLPVRETPTGGIELDYDGLRWDRPEVCEDAALTIEDSFRKFKGPVKGEPLETGTVSAAMRGTLSGLRAFLDSALSGFDEKVRDESFAQSMAGAGDRFGGMSAAQQFLENLSPKAVPDKQAVWNIGLALALARTAEESSSFPATYLATSIEYLLHFSAPQTIPEQAALNEAYLNAQISLERWTCLTKAHGHIPTMWGWALDSQRTRPDVNQTIDLWRRGHLSDEGMRLKLRELGVTLDDDARAYQWLSEFVPSEPDIVTMMKRDVFDEGIVALEKLDTDFELKLYGQGGRANPGPAAKWLKAQGVDEEVARYMWRAHWESASNTEMFAGLHRLRPDRPEVLAWNRRNPQWTPDQPEPKDDPRPLVVTMDDARKLLQINDLYPAWVERVLATSYLPMNKTDCISAFMQDAMSAEELLERFQDVGHDLPTSKRMVEVQQFLKARRVANLSGVWSIRKIVGAYKQGALTRFNADLLLTDQMPDPKMRTSILDGADKELDADWRRAKIARIRRAYFVGSETEKKTVDALIGMNLPAQRAQLMVDQWTEDKRGRLKEVTAMRIVKWVRVKLIGYDDAWDRLVSLGYSPTDARRIVYEGIIEQSDDARKAQKSYEAEQRRIIKDARQARREDAADLEKRRKELEKQIKDAQKEQERIKKELESRKP